MFHGKYTTFTSLWWTVEGPEEALWFGVSLCQGYWLSYHLNDVTDSVMGRNARFEPAARHHVILETFLLKKQLKLF